MQARCCAVAAVLVLTRMLSCAPLPVIIRLCPPVSCASSSLPQDVPGGGDMRVAARILLESLTRANEALGTPRLAEGPFRDARAGGKTIIYSFVVHSILV